jgi:hypothetical protein
MTRVGGQDQFAVAVLGERITVLGGDRQPTLVIEREMGNPSKHSFPLLMGLTGR